MKRILLTLTILLILLLPVSWAGAATYYVSESTGNDITGDGSYATPWQSIYKVESTVTGDGDKVLFLCGDTWSQTGGDWDGEFKIDWTNAIIGAYYAGPTEVDATHPCPGNCPIIDGEITDFSGAVVWTPVFSIYHSGTGATIQDIQVQNYYQGIYVYADTGSTVNDGTIQRCTINNMGEAGIILYDNHWLGDNISGWTIDSNTISNTQQYHCDGDGGYGGTIVLRHADNNTITRNTVSSGCGEGIDCWLDSDNNEVAYNYVYDHSSCGIYLSSSDDNLVHHNFVINTASTNIAFNGKRGTGFGLGAEGDSASASECSGNMFYYNVAIGCYAGFTTNDGVNDSDTSTAINYVYNNTFIDNVNNFLFFNYDDAELWVTIENNLSVVNDNAICSHNGGVEPGTGGCANIIFLGTGWDTNNENPAAGDGWIGAYDVSGDPDLVNPTPCTSGWYQCANIAATTFSDAAHGTSSAFIDTGQNLGITYSNGLDATGSWPDSVLTLNQNDYGSGWDIGAFVYQGEGETPPVNNNCSAAIAHYILDANVEDSTLNDNDLTTVGSPSHSAGGLVLNGTDQYAYITNLSADISDFTIFVNVKFTSPLGDAIANPVCGEYDTGDSEMNFLANIADPTGGGTEDIARLFVGYNAGAAAESLDSTFDLTDLHTAGTPYSVCYTWDATNKDAHIYIHKLDGTIVNGATGETGNLLDGETQNVDATPFTVGTFFSSDVPVPGKFLAGTIYELAIYASEKSQANAQAFAMQTYSDAAALEVTGMVSACGNLTSAGAMTWAIGWPQETFTTGGAWTIGATFDYPVAKQTMSYVGKWNDQTGWTNHTGDIWKKTTYIEPTNVKAGVNLLTESDGNYATLTANQWDWAASVLYVNVGSDPSDDVITPSPWETYVAISCLDGWRQDAFNEASFAGDLDITLPTGVTIVDAQDTAAVVVGALTGLGTYPANTVAIPGSFSLGTAGDYPLWSDGSTGFHDLSYDIDSDKFYVIGDFTDDVAISANNVLIRGTGGNKVITGSIELIGTITGTIIKCLTFSGGITDNDNDYVYQEDCQGQIIN